MANIVSAAIAVAFVEATVASKVGLAVDLDYFENSSALKVWNCAVNEALATVQVLVSCAA
jgi:hypothetical protein